MRAVNLLPRESRSSRGLRLDPLSIGALASTLVVAAVIGGGFMIEHSHAASEKRQLATAQAALARLQAANAASSPATPVPLQIPDVTALEQPWAQAVSSALATRVSWDDVLGELERVVPPDVTLSNLTLGVLTAGPTTPGVGGAAGTCTISGSAFSEDGVARFLSRLLLLPDLTQVTLANSTADPATGVVTFEIQAQVNQPGSVSSVAPPAATTTTPGGTA